MENENNFSDEKEVWRPVVGYEELYEVSNLGRVRSYYNKGRILKPNLNHFGYLYVNLYKNKLCKHMYVHRLVAEAFLPNLDNLPQVNHLNECKTDNRVCNLEWCTALYNNNYGTHNQRIRESMYKTEVVQLTLTGLYIATFPSQHDAARKTGIHQGGIFNCCKGIRPTYGGFKWKYLRDYKKEKEVLINTKKIWTCNPLF